MKAQSLLSLFGFSFNLAAMSCLTAKKQDQVMLVTTSLEENTERLQPRTQPSVCLVNCFKDHAKLTTQVLFSILVLFGASEEEIS